MALEFKVSFLSLLKSSDYASIGIMLKQYLLDEINELITGEII